MRRRGQGEGSIYKRGDNDLWVGTVNLGWQGGKRVRRSFYGKTRREVQDKLQVAIQAAKDGLQPTSDRLTVAAYLEEWRESIRATIRPATWRSYDQLIRTQIAPALGRIPLARLSAGDVEKMMRSIIASGRAPRTALHARAVLRTALARAARHGLIVRNAASLADAPRVEHREVEALTPAEVRTFLASLADDPLAAVYVVALATGMRQGEILGLQWQDVDLEGGSLTIRRALQRVEGKLVAVETKTQRSRRSVPLPTFAVDALREHRRGQLAHPVQSVDGWVFTTSAGTPLDGTNVTKRFQARLAEAGLRRIPFHALRHTAASLLLARGTHPRVVMELLGHSQIGLTLNTYSHVIPDLKRDAAEQMNALLTS